MTIVYYCGDHKNDPDDTSFRRKKAQHYRLVEGTNITITITATTNTSTTSISNIIIITLVTTI